MTAKTLDQEQEQTPEIAMREEGRIAVIDGNNPRASWNFSADNVRQNLAHYSPRVRENLWWFWNYCIEEGLHRDDAAAEVGYKGNTLYKIFTGRHRHPETGELLPPHEKCIVAIEEMRVRVAKERELSAREFIVTPSVERVWALCDRARARNLVGFLWGESHIGKTAALLQYASNHNHGTTKYLRIPTGSGKQEVCRLLAVACGVSPNSGYEKLKERVIKALDATMLLIVDEFHLLSFTYQTKAKWAVVELLREVKDRTRCAMVVCGTHIFRNDVELGADRHLLKQLCNRAPHKLELGDEPTAADLACFLKAYGFAYPRKHSEEEKTLRQLTRESGLLALLEALDMAKGRARNAKRKPAWEDIEAAIGFIGNQSRKPAFHA